MKSHFKERLVLNSIIIIFIFIAFIINWFLAYDYFKFVAIIIFLLSIPSFVIANYHIYEKSTIKKNISNNLNLVVDELNLQKGVGHIFFNNNGLIYYSTENLNEIFDTELIGKNIFQISSKFNKYYKKGDKNFEIEHENRILNVFIEFKQRVAFFEDATIVKMLEKSYIDERIVIYEFEIDGFENRINVITNEEAIKIKKIIINSFKELSQEYNIYYIEKSVSKYILFSNEKSLNKIIEKKFAFIKKMANDVKNEITFSMGIASNHNDLKILFKLAKEALNQCRLRGGSQIAHIIGEHKPIFYGSEIEMKTKISRIEIKNIALKLEKKLNSSEINKVIIYGHKDSDLDAFGSAYGIYEIAKSYNKEVWIQNETFDSTTLKMIKNQNYSKKIFIDPNQAQNLTNRDTLVVVVDISDFKRIENTNLFENINLEHDNVFVFDHHIYSQNISKEIESRINQYIEPNASSASEIVVEILTFLKKTINISKKCAQALLNGIILDTNQFSNSTSFRTFEASATLEKFGASTSEGFNLLKIDKETFDLYKKAVENLKEVKKGYFISFIDEVMNVDTIAIIANEFLRKKECQAIFFIGKINNKLYKLSARSNNKNVQKIVEFIGGGGRFSSAALTTSESLNVLLENLKHSIVIN